MNTRMRDRYLDDSFTTASPSTLLVRLYDRLILDLEGAEHAIERADVGRAHELLTHAQDIVTELHATLNVDLWSGAPALDQLYTYAVQELVQANVAKDGNRVATVRMLFAPLRDAWHEAARTTSDRADANVSLSA